MTWEELTEKYKQYWEEYFISAPEEIEIGDCPLNIRFDKSGTVEARYFDLGKVLTYITLATDRTPEQMDAIITALTEKK
jgi:hypothetical protein